MPDASAWRRGRLAVLGAGTLGWDVARWAAACGIEVALACRNPTRREVLTSALSRQSVHECVSTTPWTERLRIAPDVESALEGADAVLEALPEQVSLKAQAWSHIESAVTPDSLLLTGSSSLSLGDISRTMHSPARLLGFHLFVPVARMRLLELVTMPEAPPDAVSHAWNLASAMGLKVIPIAGGQGYAASRMGLSLGLEAMRLVQEGVATPQQLDELMMRGYGHPIGPLELSDRIGLDVRLAIAEHLAESQNDRRFEPPTVLRALVAEGKLGRKSGTGFYQWE